MAAKSKKNTIPLDTSKVMTSVSSVVSFMKEQIANDLLEANTKGHISLSDDDLRKVCFYVESSMTKSFTKASSQIENSLK